MLAAAGDATALRRAHRRRVDLNAKDWFDRTPLHYASIVDRPSTRECIGVLLRRGADIDARDKRGLTPADWAHESGNNGALKLFSLWRKTSPERRAQLRAQSGFTLVEMLISLSLFAVVAAGVCSLFFSGTGSADVVRAQAETAALGNALMSAYVTRASFTGLTTQSAIAEGWLPAELQDGSGMPVNAWSQPIALSTVDLDAAGDGKGARIEQGVPATEACIRFVLSTADGFDAVSVNGHDLAVADAQNPSALAGPCGDSGDMAHVVLVRRRM
jgi:prepilin-type N-terminal cleavage/methylation domain-containing protein